MKRHYIRAVGDLVQIKETVESEYFIPYQDSMIMLSLNYLTEKQKLNVLRHIITLTDGKILDSVPMQLPSATEEKNTWPNAQNTANGAPKMRHQSFTKSILFNFAT